MNSLLLYIFIDVEIEEEDEAFVLLCYWPLI